MQIGDLVRHWNFSENHLGIVIGWERIADIANFKVQWADGTCGWHSSDRLVAICKEVINGNR